MPFKSEKQRRFLWAKHPRIARRFAHLEVEKSMELVEINKAYISKGPYPGLNAVETWDTAHGPSGPGYDEFKHKHKADWEARSKAQRMNGPSQAAVERYADKFHPRPLQVKAAPTYTPPPALGKKASRAAQANELGATGFQRAKIKAGFRPGKKLLAAAAHAV